MNRALWIITGPAVAAVALWGGAVLGYRVGLALAAAVLLAAGLTFLVCRRKPAAAGKRRAAGS